MRLRAAALATALAVSISSPPSVRAEGRGGPTADDFPPHRLAVGLGLGQVSLGLTSRLYFVDPLFLQASFASGEGGGEQQTFIVFAAGARVHSTERTALLLRGGLVCRFHEDTDPEDDHVPETDGCLNLLAGFGAEVRLFWRVSALVGASMGFSPERSRWILLPEIELTVHI